MRPLHVWMGLHGLPCLSCDNLRTVSAPWSDRGVTWGGLFYGPQFYLCIEITWEYSNVFYRATSFRRAWGQLTLTHSWGQKASQIWVFVLRIWNLSKVFISKKKNLLSQNLEKTLFDTERIYGSSYFRANNRIGESGNIIAVFKIPAPYFTTSFCAVELPWSFLLLFADLRIFQKDITSMLDVFVKFLPTECCCALPMSAIIL